MGEERGEQNRAFGCHEFNTHLEDYLEGEKNSRVRMHAEECTSCRSLLYDLDLIRSSAKNWPLDSPSPRVWANIRATLAQEGFFRERESLWRKWIGNASILTGTAPVAALAFALVLAIILVLRGDIQRNAVPSSSPAPVAVSVAPISLAGVQSHLVHTVQAMEVNYKLREATLDPSAKQIYQEGLNSLDNSIQECLASLQKQPHNILVREYLMQAYAQKAEVLASALEYGGR